MSSRIDALISCTFLMRARRSETQLRRRLYWARTSIFLDVSQVATVGGLLAAIDGDGSSFAVTCDNVSSASATELRV